MILDIGLDDNRSGIEVLEVVRLDDRFVDLPVIVLTGLNLSAAKEESIRRNRAHLLYKQEGYEKVFNSLGEIIRPLAGPPEDGHYRSILARHARLSFVRARRGPDHASSLHPLHAARS